MWKNDLWSESYNPWNNKRTYTIWWKISHFKSLPAGSHTNGFPLIYATTKHTAETNQQSFIHPVAVRSRPYTFFTSLWFFPIFYCELFIFWISLVCALLCVCSVWQPLPSLGRCNSQLHWRHKISIKASSLCSHWDHSRAWPTPGRGTKFFYTQTVQKCESGSLG